MAAENRYKHQLPLRYCHFLNEGRSERSQLLKNVTENRGCGTKVPDFLKRTKLRTNSLILNVSKLENRRWILSYATCDLVYLSILIQGNDFTESLLHLTTGHD